MSRSWGQRDSYPLQDLSLEPASSSASAASRIGTSLGDRADTSFGGVRTSASGSSSGGFGDNIGPKLRTSLGSNGSASFSESLANQVQAQGQGQGHGFRMTPTASPVSVSPWMFGSKKKKSRLSDGGDDAELDDEAYEGDGAQSRPLLGRGKTEADVQQERALLRTSGEAGRWASEPEEDEASPSSRGLLQRRSSSSLADKVKGRRKGKGAGATSSRTIRFGSDGPASNTRLYPPNILRNQKYSVVSFLPVVLYEQFKFFFNLYFLLVALSQFIPALKIGFIATYIAPLAFVLFVTMGKEAFDDYQRFLRDKEANSTRYRILDRSLAPNVSFTASNDNLESGSPLLLTRSIPSSKIKVGDIVILEKNMRVPADMVLLRTSDTVSTTASATSEKTDLMPGELEPSELGESAENADEGGACFVRTDQLDGETDWKLRVAVAKTQSLTDTGLLSMRGELYADPPTKDIHTFIGNITIQPSSDEENTETSTISPLTAENMLWANTILAAGSAAGMVVYTGKETRAAMNTSEPETKIGLLDMEINWIAKILCTVTFALSVFLVGLNGFHGTWFVYIFRFLILFSSIIPISLRVNLDMGKTYYAHEIQNDGDISGAIVRTSTLPEELGRIQYLLTDKTGTLTQNGGLGNITLPHAYGADLKVYAEMEMKKLHMGTMAYAHDSMDEVQHQLELAFQHAAASGGLPVMRGRRDMSSRLKDAVLALATCHNVTPVTNDDGSVTYQASSPDEVAIVQWTGSVGVTLTHRERTRMTVRDPTGMDHAFSILQIFPFTSESKRMGIVIRDQSTSEISFVQKGADVVMAKIVAKNDWLEEECGNMAREGLRTLVVGRKRLNIEQYRQFDQAYKKAQVALSDRDRAMARVMESHLETDLELLTLTGVEDKLQDRVKPTLELLRNAGLKIWMLTGDKIETATCIAMSSKLVSRGQYIHQVSKLKSASDAREQLDFLRTRLDSCLVIDGESLQICLDQFKASFIEIATELPVVVACRCSPTQKADVARLIREMTKKRVCCIGDGGNDVSMIQAADVGVGIVGKEGKQASLAADFSILQFHHLAKLLLWHGRNSYKRSAKLAQFVIHRGLIISVIQAVYSSVFFFAPLAIYQGWLQVGYATIYTMAPVFSLVLDRDVNLKTAFSFPELYQELTKGRTLSAKTFFTWLWISLYQGGVIMTLSLFLFERQWLHIVAISFTALILNELIMVALEITTWHPYMIVSELATLMIYAASMVFLPEYFVAIIVAVSSLPLYIIKALQHRFAPAAYHKVAEW